MPRETQLVKACIDYLTLVGCYCWRNNTGALSAVYKGKPRFIRYGLPGSADILGVAPNGKMLTVECKVGKNKPTALQAEFLAEVRRRGGIAIVAYDLDDLERQYREQV